MCGLCLRDGNVRGIDGCRCTLGWCHYGRDKLQCLQLHLFRRKVRRRDRGIKIASITCTFSLSWSSFEFQLIRISLALECMAATMDLELWTWPPTLQFPFQIVSNSTTEPLSAVKNVHFRSNTFFTSLTGFSLRSDDELAASHNEASNNWK